MKDEHIVYKTKGVCATEIQFDVVNGIICNVKFNGGCKGNVQGIAALAEGLRVEDVATRLTGIDCHSGRSCPDELARAAQKYLDENEQQE